MAATPPIARRWYGNWRCDVAPHDERIAWLLTLQGVEDRRAAIRACLSTAAEAGFHFVAIDPSTDIRVPEVESEALVQGLQCILVNDAAHFLLSASLGDAERWSQAWALSRDGFDGFILCDGSASGTHAQSLFATARALVRNLDQLDWERYQ